METCVKIMHVLAPAQAGGLERVVHALAIGQQTAGAHVTVVPIVEAWTSDHPFAVPLVRAGVEIQPVVQAPRAYFRERAELTRIFRSERPDIVHTHNYHADVIAGLAARQAGVASVSTAHGFTRGAWRNRAYEYLNRLAYRWFDAVVAVSRPLAEELTRSGVPRERVHVVPNAWSQIAEPLDRAAARSALGLDMHAFVAGWVGRMSHEKGLDVFVDALIMLGDSPIHACLIGDGAERQAQEARAARSGLGRRLKWAGLVREAGRFFQAFDVLVLSSRTEGIPMVVLEAMAGCIPIVATAVGGVPEVISASEGMVVPPSNPRALADAVQTVERDRRGSARRASAARDKLDREFAEATWLDRYENVYRCAHDLALRRARPRR